MRVTVLLIMTCICHSYRTTCISNESVFKQLTDSSLVDGLSFVLWNIPFVYYVIFKSKFIFTWNRMEWNVMEINPILYLNTLLLYI